MTGARPPVDGQITFVYTTNLAAADAFYGGDLGLPLALDQGGCRIYRAAAGAYVGVCERPAEAIQAPDPARRGVILTLVTDDVEGWHARLVARGVAVEGPPAHSDAYRITHLFLRDPAGYLLEIQRFDDPDWDAAP